MKMLLERKMTENKMRETSASKRTEFDLVLLRRLCAAWSSCNPSYYTFHEVVEDS
jgi:hypothetical protein